MVQYGTVTNTYCFRVSVPWRNTTDQLGKAADGSVNIAGITQMHAESTDQEDRLLQREFVDAILDDAAAKRDDSSLTLD